MIVPWDSDLTADRAIRVLRDPAGARALVGEVAGCAKRFRWSATAERALEAYDDVVRMPTPPASPAAADAVESERAMKEMELRYWSLWNDIGPTGMALVGPDGNLPPDAQHALAALSSKSATRTPLVAALRAARKAARRPSLDG